ncbi:uncharacterized protein C8Q71DRAFT_855342 [Rhodofomes roseus]|uniref:Uncharacterized protein n=1 Tax=Rhodofomes roseus TaxID=34475 RepID=A0ABQ8KP06_9APHY|nr:uncharacterized protein C8Q71DRAFT_855342 [Rhodofomes roseus]KAH9840046.1 hypothetical protein C8Q71DRAFT_855342 [Rhodofomes roseus]
MATLAHIMINTETFFAEIFLSKKKTKVAQHTQTQVADMCVAALELGLNTGKNRGSVTSGSWAVQSPFGKRLCITVSNDQYFSATRHTRTRRRWQWVRSATGKRAR